MTAKTVSAECVGFLYTSPGANPLKVLDQDGANHHFERWTREPVYTLSSLPTVDVEVES